MTVSLPHLRVFLASPGDVGDERQQAREAIEGLAYDPLLETAPEIVT